MVELRRSGHDGIRLARGDRRQDRHARIRKSGRSRRRRIPDVAERARDLRQEGIDIKIAVINNGYLGMVRQWQDLFHGKNYSEVKINGPDFVKLAEAYGVTGIRVETDDEIMPAIQRARATQDPSWSSS